MVRFLKPGTRDSAAAVHGLPSPWPSLAFQPLPHVSFFPLWRFSSNHHLTCHLLYICLSCNFWVIFIVSLNCDSASSKPWPALDSCSISWSFSWPLSKPSFCRLLPVYHFKLFWEGNWSILSPWRQAFLILIFQQVVWMLNLEGTAF